MSRGLATFMGGAVLDIGKSIFATPLMSYSLVFFIQALISLAAIIILERVDVKEFQDTTAKALSIAMEGDLDG
jgi:BCD family chlorophyll transporter-like MFS transporter